MLKKKSNETSNERKQGEKENVQERETITHEYYSSRPKTFDTMLGGFTQVHDPDVQESQQILKNLFKVAFACFFLFENNENKFKMIVF